MRRLLFVAAVAVIALAWTGVASAGYAVGPPSGSTTSSRPTFEAYLDPPEVQFATVYVASDTQMDQYYIPAHELGSCTPTTATGTANHYTCQPTSYSNAGYGPALPPGTYTWWLSYYHTDPGSFAPTRHISGPLTFTVPQPVPPAGTSLISPADGATVTAPVTFRINAPAQSTMHIYVSQNSTRQADGTPLGLTDYSCSGQTTDAGIYYCTDQNSSSDFFAGSTYYWWAVITVGGDSFVYGPSSFSLASPPASGGGGGGNGGGGGGGGGGAPHNFTYAPYLPSATHYLGKSVKQTRLSKAAYALSKWVGSPKSIAVACWSQVDWTNISGDNPESVYSLLGFYLPAMPHWLQLSPGICRAMETLIYHRPLYPNQITANAVDTLTHEMIHALGVHDEAVTECLAMQLNWITADALGVPTHYSTRLSHLSLGNYFSHPPRYINTTRCREDGAWDIWRGEPSLPWHDFQV